MNFNHEELMLMMLYNTGTRLGLIHELRLMQCYLMPDFVFSARAMATIGGSNDHAVPIML